MNIEIANRLVELRKKNGYSQEELAEKLGLSRQAVSKWERAESSPDTDNLICLAKLYNVSLDDLLDTTQDIDEIRQDVMDKEKEEEARKYVEINDDSIIIRKDDKYVKINNHSTVKREDEKRYRRFGLVEGIVSGVGYVLVTIIYFLVSSFNSDQWSKLWVIYFVPLIIGSLISCIKKRRFTPFLYPILATFTFLTIGLYTGVWHPTWIVFMTIPLFYGIFGPIDKAIAEKRGEKIDPDDNDEDDDDEDEEDDD